MKEVIVEIGIQECHNPTKRFNVTLSNDLYRVLTDSNANMDEYDSAWNILCDCAEKVIPYWLRKEDWYIDKLITD